MSRYRKSNRKIGVMTTSITSTTSCAGPPPGFTILAMTRNTRLTTDRTDNSSMKNS